MVLVPSIRAYVPRDQWTIVLEALSLIDLEERPAGWAAEERCVLVVIPVDCFDARFHLPIRDAFLREKARSRVRAEHTNAQEPAILVLSPIQ